VFFDILTFTSSNILTLFSNSLEEGPPAVP